MSRLHLTPVSFAVNIKSNKEGIELQKLAFAVGYKWRTDSEHYNNIDEKMMQYYGPNTCIVFDYTSKFISFVTLWEVSRLNQTYLWNMKENYKEILDTFEHYKQYHEELKFEEDLVQSEVKERIIL